MNSTDYQENTNNSLLLNDGKYDGSKPEGKRRESNQSAKSVGSPTKTVGGKYSRNPLDFSMDSQIETSHKSDSILLR